MNFEKLLDYLLVDACGNVDDANVEKFIDDICSVDLTTKETQADFINGCEKTILNKIGIYRECDYDNYYAGYLAAFEQLAKKKYEVRKFLKLSDTNQVYMTPREIVSTEMELEKLNTVVDITLSLQRFTSATQLQCIEHDINKLNFERRQGHISLEQFQYQKQAIQTTKLWFEYDEEVNDVSRDEIESDNEHWEILRLKNKGKILAQPYSLYKKHFNDMEEINLLVREQAEENYMQKHLRSTILETQYAIACGVLDVGYNDNLKIYQEDLNLHIQLLNEKNTELSKLTLKKSMNDYSHTESHQELITMISAQKKESCPSVSK